jgi:ABC-type Fe3+-siderophore transport system permease subunit
VDRYRWRQRMPGQQLGSATLPIGVITAIIGVPVFLILLRIRRS